MISKNKIKELKSLQQKKFREKENKFIVEGRKIIGELLVEQPNLIIELFCTQEFLDSRSNIHEAAVTTTTSDEIRKISTLKTPQQAIAVIRKPTNNNPDIGNSDELILALDSIRDPGNLGTIIRMADWFGISTIICSTDCVDCYNPKVVQATMGAIFRVQVIYTNLIQFLESAIAHNFEVYGATLKGENMYKSEISSKSVIVMGNESDGISKETKSTLTKEIFIPNYSNQSNKSESLNVAIATSVILSEFRRVENYSK